MTPSPAGTNRWDALDFGPPPAEATEPDSSVLVDYVSDGRVAVITLNRPHADNAITTEMGARLTEILETIAVDGPSASRSSPEQGNGPSRSVATCVNATT